MARFRWLGEPSRPQFTYHDTTKLKLPTKVGPQEYLPVAPATTFPVGQDLGYEFTDPVTLAALGADPRFEQI